MQFENPKNAKYSPADVMKTATGFFSDFHVNHLDVAAGKFFWESDLIDLKYNIVLKRFTA